MNNNIFQFDSVSDNYLQFFKRQSKIHISEIILLEAHINYTQLYLRNGKKIMVAKTLKVFEDALSEYNFYRVHRGFLINAKHLKSYDSVLREVFLTNNIKAPTSRRRKIHFEEQVKGTFFFN